MSIQLSCNIWSYALLHFKDRCDPFGASLQRFCIKQGHVLYQAEITSTDMRQAETTSVSSLQRFLACIYEIK
jgi:hypothetical protein